MTKNAQLRGLHAVLLFTVFMAVVEVSAWFLPNFWIQRDARFYINANTTLLEQGGLDQHGFGASWYTRPLGWNHNLDGGWSNVALGRNGAYYPKHPWILPVLSTPFFAAFGLFGTLIYNVLMYVLTALGLYRLARTSSGSTAALLVAPLMLFATTTRDYLYDYHLDVTILALFAHAYAFLALGRARASGFLLALTVIARPTSALFALPALGLLWTDGQAKQRFKDLVLGALPVVLLAAVVNTHMFGRPWLFGYTRVLVRVQGVTQPESHTSAFSVPLLEGLRKHFLGDWSVLRREGAMFLGLLGLPFLLRRKPLYAALAFLTWLAGTLLFAKYRFEGDRFVWPALLAFVPSIALLLEHYTGLLARFWRVREQDPEARIRHGGYRATLAASWGLVVMLGTVAVRGAPQDMVGQRPYVQGATVLATTGSLDLRNSADLPRVQREMLGDNSPVARGRFGHWLPRAALPAVVLATPFARGGPVGLVVLHFILAAALAGALAYVLGAWIDPRRATLVAAFCLALAPLREAENFSGPELLTALCVLVSLACAQRARVAAALGWAWLGAWSGEQWLLLLAPVTILLWPRERSVAKRTLVGLCVSVGLAGLVPLMIYGRPFAVSEQFVLQGAVNQWQAVNLSARDYTAAWSLLQGNGHMARTIWVPLALAPLGLIALWRRDRAAALTAALLVLNFARPGLVAAPFSAPWPPLLLVLCVVLVASLTEGLGGLVGRGVSRVSPRALALGVGGVLLGMLLFGFVRVRRDMAQSFQLGSYRTWRQAKVTLGQVPCDLATWENLAWECSTLDGDGPTRVGFALPQGILVGQKPFPGMQVTSGKGGVMRKVLWENLPGGGRLVLRWAVPDGARGATVKVLLNSRELGTIEASGPATGQIHTVDFPVPQGLSAPYALEFQVRALGLPSDLVGVVALEGGFRP